MEELVSWRPGTAAESLPLVMWTDLIRGDHLVTPIVWRHRDFYSLYIVRQGKGTHIIDGVPYGVARGDVYAMDMGMTHSFSGCEYLELDTLHFSPQLFDPPTRDALAETPGFQALFIEEPLRRSKNHPQSGRWLHLTPDAYERVSGMIAELRTEWLSGTPSGVLLTRCLFLRLLVHLARLYADSHANAPCQIPRPSTRGEAAVSMAVRYMDEHFTEPIRIEQVAAMVFLSPDRFTEVFAAVMGRTPRDYLRHLRLERAKTLLRETDRKITDIAQEAGFREVAYFTRVFRTMTGTTPSAYRRSTV